MTISPQVKLTEVIAPSFYPVHQDIKAGNHTYNMTFAGDVARPIISAEIVPGIMRDPDADAIVFRKYGTTLRESV